MPVPFFHCVRHILGVWSATLTLPDYGRVVRHPGAMARNVTKSPGVSPKICSEEERGLGYSYRSATKGSTREALRAGK